MSLDAHAACGIVARTMKYLFLGFFPLLFVSFAVWAQSNESVAPDQKACAALADAIDSSWSIQSAEFVRPPFNTFARGTAGPQITVNVPFCRVAGTIKPTTDSDIHFELWLPPQSDWNSKFQGVGSGATRGSIEYQRLMQGLVRGYATVSTDSGHRSSSGDVSWALNHPERVIDFGYRAQHLATQAAKTLTQRFYGRAPLHSYFVGCSQGGHHGLMEAQRFPEDYDGIIAGAPVYDWVGEMTEQAWNVRALQQTPARALPTEKLQLLHQAVVKACGGPDGLVEDPRKCSFDPATLKCNAPTQSSCLTDGEVTAVLQMYAGPKTRAGDRIYPGLSRGSESGWDRLWSNPKELGGSWLGFYRFMVYQNPSWDVSMLDFDRDASVAEQKVGQALNPTNPDLSGFAKRGGKIIIYHGWADDMVPSQVSTDYYDSVNSKLGPKQLEAFYRLFMIPGMWHCSSGPDVLFRSEDAVAVPLEPERDMLTALEQWVEHDRAPNHFVASRLSKDGTIERTHLLCAYPKFAKYRGEGDVMRAESFACSQ